MKIVVAIGSNEFGQQIKELLGIERYEFVSVDSFIHSKTQFFILDQNHSKIIQQLKAQHLRPLVFFLANDNSPQDLLSAFDLGIDDYICCPFNSDIFIRKVNVLLARLPATIKYISALNLKLDAQTFEVEFRDKKLDLTVTEFKILCEMAEQPDHIVLRKEILDKVFGTSLSASRSLDVHVHNLRKKLTPYGLSIKTIRNIGCRLSLVAPPRVELGHP